MSPLLAHDCQTSKTWADSAALVASRRPSHSFIIILHTFSIGLRSGLEKQRQRENELMHLRRLEGGEADKDIKYLYGGHSMTCTFQPAYSACRKCRVSRAVWMRALFCIKNDVPIWTQGAHGREHGVPQYRDVAEAVHARRNVCQSDGTAVG